MADLTVRREELIQKIEAAFADVPYPGDDNFGHNETKWLIGKNVWQKLSLEVLRLFGDDILLLSAQAFHFYLPAFMCTALRELDKFGREDLIVFCLTPHEADASYKSIAEWAVPLFTSAQKSAVVEFLELYPQLFPYDPYALLEDSIAELQRAIQFWKENQGGTSQRDSNTAFEPF